MRSIGFCLTAVVAVCAAVADWLAPYSPFELAGPPLAAPSRTHVMGTDALGRDLFSAIVHGARTSLTVSVATALIATVVGAVIGLTAGYGGRLTDGVLMRFTEFVQIVPRFFLAIVVLAIFGGGYVTLVVVLGLSSWTTIARAVRAQVFSEREKPHVLVARLLATPRSHIALREVLPAVWPSVFVLAGLLIADTILIEASLSFLGLGDPDRASWGRLASEAQQYLRSSWWLPLFPGIAIVTAVLGVNLMVDGWHQRRRAEDRT